MNSDQTFNILNQNWSRKSILKRIKRGEDDDLIAYSKDIQSLEREITLFHANIVNEIVNKSKVEKMMI